jgi:hypothetical protein
VDDHRGIRDASRDARAAAVGGSSNHLQPTAAGANDRVLRWGRATRVPTTLIRGLSFAFRIYARVATYSHNYARWFAETRLIRP